MPKKKKKWLITAVYYEYFKEEASTEEEALKKFEKEYSDKWQLTNEIGIEEIEAESEG